MNHRGHGGPGCPSQMGQAGRKAPGTLTEDLAGVGVMEGASLALPEHEFPTVMGTVPTTYMAFFHGGRQDRPQSHFTSPVEKCPQQLIQVAAPRHRLAHRLLYIAHGLLDSWRPERVELPEKPRALL